MRKSVFFISIALIFSGLNAQSKIEKDREAIKAMTGCYKVTFNYAETFYFAEDYKKQDNSKSWAYEYVTAIEDEPKHISLQHLLIVNEDKDPMIIKHWRQDWDYENTDFYMFHQYNNETKGQEWKFVRKSPEEVKGQWTQKVYQVDDSPRYEGSATWVHYDGRHYWDNTTDAPLPRREYSQRSDYNVTQRTNHHEITDYGWLHEQDNAKVLRENGEDKIIAYEKGWNTYEKVEPEHCKVAEEWWSENHEIWSKVRKVWNERFEEDRDLNLWPKKGVKQMYKSFFKLDDKSNEADIKEIIANFSTKD